jgi:hypothetical protein
MTEQSANLEADDGATLISGDRHFGRWWVARSETVTSQSVESVVKFYGYQGTDLLQIEGIEAARVFSQQLQAAIEYAEAALKPDGGATLD